MSFGALISAVNAGVYDRQSAYRVASSLKPHQHPGHFEGRVRRVVSNGSVDAAIALMGAALPGWWWELGPQQSDLFHGLVWSTEPPYPRYLGQSGDPASALLLAALSAMEAAA